MTREEILEGLYEIKNWKCNGDAKTHNEAFEKPVNKNLARR